MKTSAFVSRVLRVCPSVTRVAVIDEINNALNIIFDRPLPIMRVYDDSTGLDPILSTVSGTLVYSTNDVGTTENIAYIGRIFEDSSDPTTEVSTSVLYSSRILTGDGVKIKFYEDPGTASLYVETYKRPTEILAESNPANIPFSEEFTIKYLFEMVVGNLEMMMHGQSSRLDKLEQYSLPQLYAQLAETNNITTYITNRY